MLVCGECAGDARALRKRLKKELKRQDRGKACRIIRTGCMGVCPKDAVTVGLGRDLSAERPRVHVVRDEATRKDLRALLDA